jgi:hypothetical protein
LGHVGWHRKDGMEWFGDAWWLPPETLDVVPALIDNPVSKLPKQAADKALKRAAVWIGSVVLALIVMGVLLVVERVANAPKPDLHAHCAMQPRDCDVPRPLRPERQRTP